MFFINVPIGAAVVVLAQVVLSESHVKVGRSFDVAGGLTITASLVILIYAVVGGPDMGRASARTVGLLPIGGVLLVAVVAVELRASVPLMQMRLFRLPTVLQRSFGFEYQAVATVPG